MELRQYLAILWGRKWVILTTLIITLCIVIIGTDLAIPQYLATAKIRVATAAGSASSSDYLYADRLLNTYTNIATSGPTLEELANRLARAEPPDVKAEILPNTEIIQIAVEDADPVLAANAANILAEILIAQSQQLYSGGGKSPQEILSEQLAQTETELNQARQDYENLIAESPGDTDRIAAASRAIELKQEIYASLLNQYEQARVKEAIRANTISVIEPAKIPEAPSKPRLLFNVALGLVVGLAGGIGLAFLFENLDTTLYTSEQIESATNSSSLGKIPTVRNWQDSVLLNGNSPFGEAFRRLRTQILMSDPDAPLHKLLITSSEQGEGKSMVSANLAYAYAQTGRKVILVDCDLRRPSQHKIFNLPNKVGLSAILKQEATLEEVVQKTKIPTLQILASGPLPANPAELLGSSQMFALLQQLEQNFEIVLIDAPSLLAVADAALLVPYMDSVMLVVSRGEAREKTVRSACNLLSEIHARSVGVIINHTEHDCKYYYYSGRREKKEKISKQ
jgi:capsular exopolysaccharide synthesis family protein